MNFDSVQMFLPFVTDILEKNEYSKVLAGYVDRFILDYASVHYENVREGFLNGLVNEKADRIASCGKLFVFDKYEKQRIKMLKGLSLCKHRFCPNCQKQRQLTKLFKFGPILDASAETNDLYHLVLTVPNCSSDKLIGTLSNMLSSFTTFVNLFLVGENRKRKARKEFFGYGCVAALRNCEITFDKIKRKSGEEYHAHLHVILALRKGLEMPKVNVNSFSYDYSKGKKLVRYFSDFEIKLQRIWYLIINGYKYSRKNYETIKGRYSVTLDLIDANSYYEVFKYTTKIYGENSMLMEYEQFSTLYSALQKRRSFQGYGDWYNICGDDDINEEYHEVQKLIEAYLCKTEDPEVVYNRIDEVVKDMTEDLQYVYLNMKSIHNIGNVELEQIKELGASAEMRDILKVLQENKLKQKIETIKNQFKEVYFRRIGEYPSEQEMFAFENDLQIDDKDNVFVLRGMIQANVFGENNIFYDRFNKYIDKKHIKNK